MYRTIIVIFLVCMVSSVSAQTVQRQNGTLHLTQQLSSNVTAASDLVGAILGVTYADQTREEFVWQDLGNNTGGVQNSRLSFSVTSIDVFTVPWTFTNLDQDIVGFDLHTAPAQVVFDLDPGGTQGSGNGGRQFQLEVGTDLPFDSITATYSDILALTGSDPVGDLYATLAVQLSQPLQANESIVFSNDLDSSVSEIFAVPEPCGFPILFAMALPGLQRRKRTAKISV